MPAMPGMRMLVCLALLVTLPAIADARSEKTVGWTAARVFPAAVRFLRVDEGVTIVEKDAEAGYVMFELTDEGQTFPGALELVALDDGKLRLVLRIEDRPDYMEVGMLDRLERKLTEELGPAKKKPRPQPKDPPKEPPASEPGVYAPAR
jgi:hypothetical protein